MPQPRRRSGQVEIFRPEQFPLHGERLPLARIFHTFSDFWFPTEAVEETAGGEALFFLIRQGSTNLIRCLENAFRSFSGVVKVLNLDNLRAAVQQADWCDPVLNPKLLSFCRH